MATSYPAHTILRYYPSDGSAHYTAIVINEAGNLLEVKRGAVKEKQEYEDLESWLESLPNQPSEEDLTVNQKQHRVQDEKDQEQEQEQGQDEKKKKKEKLKLRLLPYSQRIQSTYWTIHVYHIIKEANPMLLKQENVIEAFNEWVEVLVENQPHVYSHLPTIENKYREGVNLDANSAESPLKGMCEVRLSSMIYNEQFGHYVRRHYYYDQSESEKKQEERKIQENAIRDRIVDAYRKLFVLIRSDVVPYMDRMLLERQRKQHNKRVEFIVNRMERFQDVYEKELNRRLALLDAFRMKHERHMNSLRNQLTQLNSS